MSSKKSISKVKATSKNVFMVNLVLSVGTGSRLIPNEWMGVDIKTVNPDLAKKFELYVDKTKVHILPLEVRKDLANFNQRVRNYMKPMMVPMGVRGKTMNLMSKTMYDKAQIQFDLFSDELDIIVDRIEAEFSSYEDDFYSIFEELLKGNIEKDEILKELRRIMPTEEKMLDSIKLEIERLKLESNKELENRFIGKALGITNKRIHKIEALANKHNKVDQRTLAGIKRDIADFEALEVANAPMIKEIIKDLEEIHSLSGNGKAVLKKSLEMKNKIVTFAIKARAVDFLAINN